MRIAARLICLLTCVAGFGQAASNQAGSQLQLAVSDYGKHFFYSIPHPEMVRKAWIEVLDRPLVLDQKPIAIQANGAFDWDWDRSGLNDYEQPEDNLTVEIWDPNGETLTCDANTVMRSEPGGAVAGATIGGRQQFRPSPHVGRSWIRVAEGSGGITFDGTGIDLSPSTKFSVKASGGGRCNQRSLRVRVLDLLHMRITLGADCLRKPGILLITTANDSGESAPPVDFFEGATVHVASKSSPTLTSVSPSSLPDNLRQDKMRLVLHGRGFTKDSVVYAGYYPDANDFQLDQLWPETEFVSPTELRVHVDPAHAGEDTVAQPQGEKLRFWVNGNEEKFELSQPFDVTLRPTGQPLPVGRLSESDFRRWKPETALVTSMSPFPIRLMDEHSPKELMVLIRGENFSPQDTVRFLFGNNVNNDREVRSEYVSRTMLRAWLPRQFWRKHAVSYHLIVETKEGKLLTRHVDETFRDYD